MVCCQVVYSPGVKTPGNPWAAISNTQHESRFRITRCEGGTAINELSERRKKSKRPFTTPHPVLITPSSGGSSLDVGLALVDYCSGLRDGSWQDDPLVRMRHGGITRLCITVFGRGSGIRVGLALRDYRFGVRDQGLAKRPLCENRSWGGTRF